jgi:hypothetical protein
MVSGASEHARWDSTFVGDRQLGVLPTTKSGAPRDLVDHRTIRCSWSQLNGGVPMGVITREPSLYTVRG